MKVSVVFVNRVGEAKPPNPEHRLRDQSLFDSPQRNGWIGPSVKPQFRCPGGKRDEEMSSL